MSRIYDREKLRAELAGKAMQGMLSNPGILPYCDQAIDSNQDLTRGVWYASQATAFADALLAELDRTAEDPIKAGGTE